jgi:hypothetical protein
MSAYGHLEGFVVGARLRGGAWLAIGTGGLAAVGGVLPGISTQVDLIGAINCNAFHLGADAGFRIAGAVTVSPGSVAILAGPMRLTGPAMPGWLSRSPFTVPTRSWPKGLARWWWTSREAMSAT